MFLCHVMQRSILHLHHMATITSILLLF